VSGVVLVVGGPFVAVPGIESVAVVVIVKQVRDGDME